MLCSDVVVVMVVVVAVVNPLLSVICGLTVGTEVRGSAAGGGG